MLWWKPNLSHPDAVISSLKSTTHDCLTLIDGIRNTRVPPHVHGR